jgi:uncharacterized protein (TIGR00730 family)
MAKRLKVPRPIIKNIAFFGDANVSKNDSVYKGAFEVAKTLASEGYTIVNGGGPGVMNASTQGAEEIGGETLSVTFSPTDAPGYEGRYVGNITDIEIKTTNYIERMFKLLEHADCFIIFKGGSGTISEFGTAWVLGKIYYGHHKPFILFGEHWVEIVDAIKKNMNVDSQEMGVFEIVRKKEEVLPVIFRFEKNLRRVDHRQDCRICIDKAFMK